MKPGANFQDINRIRAMYAEGKSAEEISAALNIVLTCVESYAPQPAKKKAAKKTPEVTEEVNDGDSSEYQNSPGGE
jgi:hypothetical protein